MQKDLCLALFLFVSLVSNSVFGSYYSVETQDIPEGARISSLEVISFNVGNMGDNPVSVVMNKSCPDFKLCRPKSIAFFKDWFSQVQPDVLLLQETLGIDQVAGQKFGGPLVDQRHYDAFCNYHACVVWKKSTVQIAVSKEKSCRMQTDPYGDLILCELAHKGQLIQFISAYFPAVKLENPPFKVRLLRRKALSEFLFEEQKNFVAQKKPVVVGGDFNTPDCTFQPDCKLPYPENYYTLVGNHVEGYGKFHELLDGRTMGDSFFGAYQYDQAITFHTHYYYFLKHQFDQMFANFGFPVEDESSVISPYAGSTCGSGLSCPDFRGQDFDHRPIFGRIGFYLSNDDKPTTPAELQKQVTDEQNFHPVRNNKN